MNMQARRYGSLLRESKRRFVYMASSFYLDRIKRIYDERRIINRRTEEERYRKVCSEIPGFEALDSDRSDVIKNNIEQVALGNIQALKDTRQYIADTEKKSLSF